MLLGVFVDTHADSASELAPHLARAARQVPTGAMLLFCGILQL